MDAFYPAILVPGERFIVPKRRILVPRGDKFIPFTKQVVPFPGSMNVTEALTISQVARMLEAEMGFPIPPRVISDLFYQRVLEEDLGPLVGGRRLIRRDAFPKIRLAVLKQRARQETQAKADQARPKR